LISALDPVLNRFLASQEDDLQRVNAAYQIFRLLKATSRAVLISAIRELVSMRCFKIKALISLLRIPQPMEGQPLWPYNRQLLDLTYQERSLEDYDPDSPDMESA